MQPRSPDSITPRPCTPTPRAPDASAQAGATLRGGAVCRCVLRAHGLQVLRPPAQEWPWLSCVLWCSSPQPCSPPAPPHGSRWSPLPSVWTVQPGCPGHLSHRSASHHLWAAHEAGLGSRLSKATAPAAGVRMASGVSTEALPPHVCPFMLPDAPPYSWKCSRLGPSPTSHLRGDGPCLPESPTWLFPAPTGMREQLCVCTC